MRRRRGQESISPHFNFPIYIYKLAKTLQIVDKISRISAEILSVIFFTNISASLLIKCMSNFMGKLLYLATVPMV